jgi:response regulator RpfG family c-di-GMP phosphodiesterase
LVDSTSRPTLLLVDDEDRILSALRRCLRREGYEIVTAQSVTRALAVLDERRIDLVLSDQKMPGMSGIDLLREVQRIQPAAARLLITGWSQAVAQEDLASVGISALIPKPWDDAELKQSLRAALAEREA